MLRVVQKSSRAIAFRPSAPLQPPMTRPYQPAPTRANFGTSRRLARLKDQGPFGDGFMDLGCKTIKVLLGLVLVNVVVLPLWQSEEKKKEGVEDEVAKVQLGK